MSSQPIKPRQPLSVKNVPHNPSQSKLHPTDDTQTGLKSAVGSGLGDKHQWSRPFSRLPQSSRKTASTSKLKATRTPPPTLLTPKKRAVPQEDVHCRNVVTGTHSPSKRSRSSNTESGSGSEAKPPSTGTSLGISAGLNEIHVGGGRSTLVQGPAAVVGASLMRSTAATPSSKRATPTVAAPSNPPPHPRPTTTRIDKHSRMTETDRAARELVKKQASEEWRKKYLRAFPSFVFHLDGLDAATKQHAEQSITQLGARIEPFFSRSVSHLVTARKPSATPSQAISTSRASVMPGTPLRKQQSVAKTTRHKAQPIHSDRNPFEDFGPSAPSNDIISKAEEFGMKVWNLEKLSSVLASLLGNSHVAGPSNDTHTRQGLEQMLKQERLQGTSERDPNAARADYHYFNSKNCCYILVEDATCEHRVIMAQEYEKPANRDEEPAWPRLYGEIEGRCPFTKFDLGNDYRKKIRGNQAGTLRRAVSMGQIDRGHLRVRQGGSASPQPAGPLGSIARHFNPARGASPYPMASGNSMALTSNMNSTTSAAIGSQASFGASAVAIDKRFASLGRRVHTPGISPLVIRGTMASGLGISSALPSPTVPQGALTAGSARSLSASHDVSNGAVVRRMLGMTERPVGGIRRSVSTADAGRPLQREKKPGYCENCRVKYSDFDEHINHRRHRKFASDAANFADVDRLLARVERPLAAWVQYNDYSAQGSTSPMDELPVVPGYQMDGSEAFLVADEHAALPDEEQMYAEYFEGVGEASVETTEETRTPQTSPDAQRLLYDPKNQQQQLFDPTNGYYDEHGEPADWVAVPRAQ